jgi:hypothetical protein
MMRREELFQRFNVEDQAKAAFGINESYSVLLTPRETEMIRLSAAVSLKRTADALEVLVN